VLCPILYRGEVEASVSAQNFTLLLKNQVQKGTPCMCDYFSDISDKALPIHQPLVLTQKFNKLNKFTVQLQ